MILPTRQTIPTDCVTSCLLVESFKIWGNKSLFVLKDRRYLINIDFTDRRLSDQIFRVASIFRAVSEFCEHANSRRANSTSIVWTTNFHPFFSQISWSQVSKTSITTRRWTQSKILFLKYQMSLEANAFSRKNRQATQEQRTHATSFFDFQFVSKGIASLGALQITVQDQIRRISVKHKESEYTVGDWKVQVTAADLNTITSLTTTIHGDPSPTTTTI